jgi:saccharopine dehydrogenase-like NADP-dependent oxidoreductase
MTIRRGAMKQILLIGAGNIGEMIVDLLLPTGDYVVTVADRTPDSLARIVDRPGVSKVVLDAMNPAALSAALAGKFAVISAAPYHVTTAIARAAHAAGVHYLDPTEDVASTRVVKELSKTATSALIPQCGLAPGFIAIVGKHLADKFETLDTLRLHVGALPRYPTNTLTYNLTWSTEGVINEYCEPCEAVIDGKHVMVPALENVDRFILDGEAYEAFNTSGGLGTLSETLDGKVRNLSYRTIRYPGHRDIMKTLIQDLRLGQNRALFKQVLEQAVPSTDQDVVLVFATAIGTRGGQLMQESYLNKVYAQEHGGKLWAAIQITTAGAICAVLDLLSEGKLPTKGFVRQEDIGFATFMANRFGRIGYGAA